MTPVSNKNVQLEQRYAEQPTNDVGLENGLGKPETKKMRYMTDPGTLYKSKKQQSDVKAASELSH